LTRFDIPSFMPNILDLISLILYNENIFISESPP